MATTVAVTQRRPPPRGGWPTPEEVPSHPGRLKWRCRKVVDGKRPTIWGESEEDALDAWKAWWNAGCPPQARRPLKSTSAPASDDDPNAIPPVRMSELFARFLEASDLAKSTRKRYRSDIENHLKPNFGDKAFPLERPVLVRWKEAMVSADLPTTTIARRLTTMSSAFSWAVDQGWIAKNPASRIKHPKPQARVRASQSRDVAPPLFDIPSIEEVQAFLGASKAAGDPLYALWRTGFKLGLRPGELAALDERTIRIGSSGSYQYVWVHQKLFRDEGTPAVKDEAGRIITKRVKGELILEQPKYDGVRTIELDPDDPLFELLIGQAELMRELAERQCWDPYWGGLLFRRLPGGRQGRGGSPYPPDALPGLFKKAAARAGWPEGRTPHFMRHFAASNLIRAGYSSKAACEILGHRSVRTFEETYAHVILEARRAVRLSDATAGLE